MALDMMTCKIIYDTFPPGMCRKSQEIAINIFALLLTYFLFYMALDKFCDIRGAGHLDFRRIPEPDVHIG